MKLLCGNAYFCAEAEHSAVGKACGRIYIYAGRIDLPLEFFGIGITSFFLALQQNNNPISGNFLVNAMRKALPGALAVVIEVILAYLVAKPLNLDGDQLRTVVVLCATYTGFMMLYIACQPFNLHKFLLFMFCISASFFVTIASMYELKIIIVKRR